MSQPSSVENARLTLLPNSVILEMNVESYRQRATKSKQALSKGKPATPATKHNNRKTV